MIPYPLNQISFSLRGIFLLITSQNSNGSPWLLYKTCGLSDQEGHGIKVKGFPSFEFSASHYTANDLYCAKHTNELKPHDETWLNIDHGMRGLGTASCGADTLDEYRLVKSKYKFTYAIEPINRSNDNN